MLEIKAAESHQLDTLIVLNRVVQRLHASRYPDIFKAQVDEEALRSLFTRQIQDDDSRLLVAQLDQQVAGYIWARIANKKASEFTHARKIMFIQQLTVDPSLQHQGIATMLVAAVEEIAKAEGIARVQLDYWAFNDTAAAFFSKQGYTPFNLLAWKNL